MGSLIFTVVVAGGIVLAGVGYDIGINAAQNWYDVVYSDALWSARVKESEAVKALDKEEAEIRRQLDESEFAELPQAPSAVAAQPAPVTPTRR